MIFQPHRIRPLAVAGVLLLAAACGGDKAKSGDESGATAGDVDQKSEATITEREAAAFTPPADSSVTPQQVEAYLKTSLLQFDLIRAQFNADPDGMKQRTPFGLLAAAMADIVLSVGHSARDRRNLHHARIGAATAIKENPQASVRTRSHKAYASAGSTAHSPRHCR